MDITLITLSHLFVLFYLGMGRERFCLHILALRIHNLEKAIVTDEEEYVVSPNPPKSHCHGPILDPFEGVFSCVFS